MSIDARLKAHATLFGGWELAQEPIGSGSNGTVVYKMKRGNSEWTEFCAVKAIPLAEEYGSLDARSPENQAIYGRELFRKTQKAKNEIITMEGLRGNTHIVDYLDYAFQDWKDETGFGRDLYIRMELLSSLGSDMRHGKVFTEQEIIRIGCDICKALILCHSKGIIHRDIKPGNIFYNKDGNYKLGDFGISKSLPDIANSYVGTGIGTFAYMPPEQLKGKYTRLVDIYSLGLVLYELSNGNKLPFSKSTHASDQEIIQRLSGNSLPAPEHAGTALKKVILKACAPNPGARYASAEEFLAALEHISQASSDTPKPALSSKLLIPIGAAAAVVLLLALGSFFRKEPGTASLSETAAAHAQPSVIEYTETTHATEEEIPAVVSPVMSPRPVHMFLKPPDISDAEQGQKHEEAIWGQWAHKRKEVTAVVFEDNFRTLPEKYWDLSAEKDQSILAWMDNGTLHIASEGIIAFPENLSWFFSGFSNMRSLDFGTNVDFSGVSDMSHMFSACKRLTELDLSMLDTSSLTNMDCMFYDCHDLVHLDLSSFDTSHVTNMNKLFAYCNNLSQVNLSSFNTSRVRTMSFMFYWCESLTELDLTGFDTPRLENMNSMFYHCSSLETLDLSSFNTSRVYSMNYVFSGCEKLDDLDLSNFDLSQNPSHKEFMDSGKLINGKPWSHFFS